MRQTLYLIAAAVMIISVIAWNGYSQKSKAPRTSWEYMVIPDPQSDESARKLNELGVQGWELVGVSDYVYNQGNYTSTRFVLKRSQ